MPLFFKHLLLVTKTTEFLNYIAGRSAALKTPRLSQQCVFLCVNSKCSTINPNNSSSNGMGAKETSNERSKRTFPEVQTVATNFKSL